MPETLRDRRVRHARSIIMPQPTSAALLGESGDLAGLRVLVLGNAVSETLCALMHTECRRAETRMPGCQTEARSADLVLVPHLTRESVDRVISQATHALPSRPDRHRPAGRAARTRTRPHRPLRHDADRRRLRPADVARGRRIEDLVRRPRRASQPGLIVMAGAVPCHAGDGDRAGPWA